MSAERREEETMSESMVPREAAVSMVGEDAADALLRVATKGIGKTSDKQNIVAWSNCAVLYVPTRPGNFVLAPDVSVFLSGLLLDRKPCGKTTVDALRAWCGPGTPPDCDCVPCPFCEKNDEKGYCEPCEDWRRLTWRAGRTSDRKRVRSCNACKGTGKRAHVCEGALLYGEPVDAALLGAWLAAAPMLTGAVTVHAQRIGVESDGMLFMLVCDGGTLVLAGLRNDVMCTRSFDDGATGGA